MKRHDDLDMGAAILILAVLAAPAVAVDTSAKVREPGAITPGYRESSVPFFFVDANKQPVSHSIDLCTKVVNAESTATQ